MVKQLVVFLVICVGMSALPVGAQSPSGNTEKDIQNLFNIIAQQKQLIDAQQQRIGKLEGQLATNQETTRATVREVVREEGIAAGTSVATLLPTERSGVFASVGAAALQLGGLSDIDYAVLQHPDDSEGQIGRMHSVDFGFSAAWRASLGYRFDNGDELSLSYLGGEFEGSGSATDPDGNLMSVLLHCENGDADGVDTARAKIDAELHRIGVNFMHPFYDNGRMRMGLDLGVNYISLEQDLGVKYYDDGDLEAFIDAQVRNDMIGPRIGCNVEYAVLKRLALNMNFGLSCMYIRSDLDQVEGPFDDVDAPVDITDEREGITLTADATLGLIWRPTDRIKVGLGYEMMWLNDAFTLQQGLDDTSEGQSRQWETDLTLHGVMLDATFTF